MANKDAPFGLKPHNMSEEAWLKSVAKEKQKISQREAK